MLKALAKGMGTTLRMLFRKKQTIAYPYEEEAAGQRFRGRHELRRYEQRAGDVHRLRAVPGGVSGGGHHGHARGKRSGAPQLARGAVRVEVRDRHAALHFLRAVRRGVPDRGAASDAGNSSWPTSPGRA